MTAGLRRFCISFSAVLLTVLVTALPLAAQEGAASPAEAPGELVFRWLNFILVFGAIAYAIGKFGTPYFRSQAREISGSIHQAAEARAAAKREVEEAERQVASLDLEIQDLRRAAVRDSATEAERIRDLARVESDRIAQAAHAEIAAAERAARQDLRAAAARLATEQAAAMVRTRLNAATEAGLFRSFVSELQRSAT
jgi:F0F1-type ATP synthase membrane subunit b/b'